MQRSVCLLSAQISMKLDTNIQWALLGRFSRLEFEVKGQKSRSWLDQLTYNVRGIHFGNVTYLLLDLRFILPKTETIHSCRCMPLQEHRQGTNGPLHTT